MVETGERREDFRASAYLREGWRFGVGVGFGFGFGFGVGVGVGGGGVKGSAARRGGVIEPGKVVVSLISAWEVPQYHVLPCCSLT